MIRLTLTFDEAKGLGVDFDEKDPTRTEVLAGKNAEAIVSLMLSDPNFLTIEQKARIFRESK